ncbi:MAG: phage antirepressor N-terminal domain-containing protein [Chloroflexota bacterium]
MNGIEQKQVLFQGRKITAVLVQDKNGRENVYVPLRPLVQGMGLDWSAQRKRIKKNPVLSDVCISVAVTATETGRGKGSRNILSIPISHLNGMLFGINADRVREDIRPLLIEYQKNCYQILFDAFNGIESMRRFYTAVGLDEKWIAQRIEKHRSFTSLGDVWLETGIPIEKHTLLEDVINKGAFGLTISEHKAYKHLPESEDLRDNMTGVELLISIFGDEATERLVQNESPEGLAEHMQIAEAGGHIAGKMRQLFEEETGGRPVLSKNNNLDKKRPLLD